MKNGTCPECHSTEVYRSGISPLQAGDSLVRVYNPAGNDLPIEIYVCASCGHIEMSIAESYKARLADLVKFNKWQKVG
jgi:hypothetical protein